MFMKYILKLLSSENAKPERSDVQWGQEELNTQREPNLEAERGKAAASGLKGKYPFPSSPSSTHSSEPVPIGHMANSQVTSAGKQSWHFTKLL